MPAIQGLKKQLRGIRSTQKLTKAMRTVATVKFSKLNDIFAGFSEYGRKCREVYCQYEASFCTAYPLSDPNAPTLVLVISSNKGMCGSFNSELLSFAAQQLEALDSHILMTVGQKAKNYFEAKGFAIEKSFTVEDIPSYADGSMLLSEIGELRLSGRVSGVMIIYPEYRNMMIQKPAVCSLFSGDGEHCDDNILFLPERESMLRCTAKTVFSAMVYELLLESALGAQAATLMTMRSAYDTASEYCLKLEGQINRLRQSAVTADVIETSNQ